MRNLINLTRNFPNSKNGLDYWIAAPLINTSEKYDYMNYIQLIGKGKKAIMAPTISVTYDLYKVLYTE